jgi:transporter family protein
LFHRIDNGERSLVEWLIYALLSAVTAALATILAKIGLSNMNPLYATMLRSLAMTIIILLTLIVLGENTLSRVDMKSLTYIVLSALAGAASWILYFYALRKGEATRVAMIDKSSLLFILVLAIIFLNEKPTPTKIIAATLITIGMILAAM